MSPSIVISAFSILIGIVLGSIALGLIQGAPAVLGFLAGWFLLAGFLMPNVLPDRQAPEVAEQEVVE